MAFSFQDNLLGAVDPYTVDNAGGGAYSLVGTSTGKMGRYAYPSVFADMVDPVFGGGIATFAQVAPITAQTISSITISGSTATMTTGSAHNLSVGSVIQIAGALPIGYNGIFTVATVPSTTTLTFSVATFTDPRWNPNNPNVINPTNPNIPTVSATTVGTYVPGIGAGQVVQFVHAKDTFGNLILQAQVWTGAANSGLSLGVALSNALATTTSSIPSNPFGGQYAWFQIGGAMVCYTAGAPAIGNQTYWAVSGGSSTGGAVTPSAVASKQMQGTQYASAAGATFGSGTSGTITLPANVAVIWGTFPLAQGAIT
ncbi:hypothetical protein [Paludibacterium sp.]|uniref:hypothetical protein n=1 Tax=Paludibacterium sp. TaxID=1917523 RepID=UPI0025D25047|nr:hypothetical protein [Paludibacterium sp.]MBV8649688.1 hypothetical protein [Paludibacterium sp.]